MIGEVTPSGAMNIWGAATMALIGTLTLIGFAVKFIALPWLRSNLVEPVQKTHHQVAVNHHSSETPTLKDMIDDVRKDLEAARLKMLTSVSDLRGDLSEVKDEVRVIRHTQDRVGTELKEHLEWSEEARKASSAEQIAMWEAIGKIAAAPASPIEAVLEPGSEESK